MKEIKNIFDNIKAEDELKEKTKLEIGKKIYAKRRIFTPLRASLAFVLIFILLFENLYFSPVTYVDIDANSAFELGINRFSRVVKVYAYNKEGEEILENINLYNKSIDKAFDLAFEEIESRGYHEDLLSVTVNSEIDSEEEILIEKIRKCTSKCNHKNTDIFSVSDEIKNISKENNISPAKLVAIESLQKVEPETSIEGCRHNSISEIKEVTRNHKNQNEGGNCNGGNNRRGHNQRRHNQTGSHGR